MLVSAPTFDDSLMSEGHQAACEGKKSTLMPHHALSMTWWRQWEAWQVRVQAHDSQNYYYCIYIHSKKKYLHTGEPQIQHSAHKHTKPINL